MYLHNKSDFFADRCFIHKLNVQTTFYATSQIVHVTFFDFAKIFKCVLCTPHKPFPKHEYLPLCSLIADLLMRKQITHSTFGVNYR